MGDQEIFEHIDELVSEERALRSRSAGEDSGLSAQEKARLREVEIRLDQYWDLLRRRRALTEYGEDPSAAVVRPPEQVENYES